MISVLITAIETFEAKATARNWTVVLFGVSVPATVAVEVAFAGEGFVALKAVVARDGCR